MKSKMERPGEGIPNTGLWLIHHGNIILPTLKEDISKGCAAIKMGHFANVNFSLTKICWRAGLFCSVSFDFFEVARDQNLGSGADLPDKKTGKFHQLQLWFGWNCVGFNKGLDYILQASVKARLCFSNKWWETLEGDQRYWGEIDLFKTKKRNWLKYFWPITTYQKQ